MIADVWFIAFCIALHVLRFAAIVALLGVVFNEFPLWTVWPSAAVGLAAEVAVAWLEKQA